MASEFEEIGHSGGRITFSIKTDEKGQVSYQVEISSYRPVPTVNHGQPVQEITNSVLQLSISSAY